MLIAQLKGKLTIEEERLEDLLTSNVFGSFKYVKPEDGLLSFLKEARTLDGSRLFANLPHVCSCYYEFWPVLNYSASCEPDAIIWLTHHDGSLAVVMVESKYLSGKSSLPSQGMLLTDQLAKEWDNLKYLLIREKADFGCLLYVTADYVMPRKAIEESQKELENKRGKQGCIAWVSWRVLPKILEETKEPILADLRGILLKQRLVFFRGINVSSIFPITVEWSFIVHKKEYQWEVLPLVINWSFEETPENLYFEVKQITSDWRFYR